MMKHIKRFVVGLAAIAAVCGIIALGSWIASFERIVHAIMCFLFFSVILGGVYALGEFLLEVWETS